MRTRCTIRGYLGLLVGLAAAAFYLGTGSADPPAQGQEEPGPPPSFAPTEKIDVEQAVDFPYDI